MKIGAAWKKTSANGNEFISILIELPIIGKINFVLFANEKKEAENQPDYNVVWSPNPKKNGKDDNPFNGDDSIPF